LLVLVAVVQETVTTVVQETFMVVLVGVKAHTEMMHKTQLVTVLVAAVAETVLVPYITVVLAGLELL
jgi:hypothetical protein